MNTSNKRLKIGASFPGFYLTFLTPRLARLSLLTPCLTLARASQQNTCLFHPTDGESHPSRLRASISSQVTASASRPPNFTFPSSPVQQRVLISRRMPARASRPDNLTFSTPRPTYLSVFTCPTQRAWSSRRTPARASRPDNFTFSNLLLNEAHPSDTAISKPVGRRQEPPRQQPHFFLLDEAYSSDTAISKPVGRRREPTGQVKLIFSILRPAKAYPTTLPVDCEAFRPLNFTLPSKTCPLGEPRYPDVRRREHSRPDNLLFSSLRSPRLTVRHGDPETTVGRELPS